MPLPGTYVNVGHLIIGYGTPAPTVPTVPALQTTLPTSAYGQTIPVIYGKARLPAAYIWVAPILTVTSSHVEWWDTITTTTSEMTCRVRFARPLVPNSSWTLRRLYANGKAIYDATIGYRQKNLRFTLYDGKSDQPRDPAMVREEDAFVSAHRGYIDIVFDRYDIAGLGAPPVFEAEIIQDGVPTHDYDTFTTFTSDDVNLVAPDWDNGILYGFDYSPRVLRRFSIGAETEYFSVGASFGENYFTGLRYIPSLDRLVCLSAFTGVGDYYGNLIDPLTGAAVAVSSSPAASGIMGGTCLSETSRGAILVGFSDAQQIFAFYATATTIERSYQSITGWGGYSSIQCAVPGEVRGSEADFWFCADAGLIKVTLTSLGTFKSSTIVAAMADDLRYAVYDAGDLVVWTDAATVKRVNGTTGAIEYSKSVPYQIGIFGVRQIGESDLQRFVDELYFYAAGNSYFTNLQTGITRTVSGASTTNSYLNDGESDLVITFNNAGIPQRMIIVAGDGTQRQLSDFLIALFEAGGYLSSQIATFNIDDVIDGAVIDVTAGVRDIARSIGDPYSIAIFERAGQVIFKRAFTDGAFAVDATLSSAGDIADSGGQAIKARRLNPADFVARYGINYRDPAEIYQERPQFGEIPSLPLPVAPADQSVKASIPIIVDADTVKVLATQKVNRLAIERHEFDLTCRAKYADLEPEDIIQFAFANRTITSRITECTVRPDYMIDIIATEFLSSVSISISGATGRPVDPVPVGTPASRYYHLDIPLLSDGDDRAGAALVQYHVLASAGQPYWDGATLYRRDAAGLYQPVAGQVTNGIVGIALEVLPDWDTPYVTEFTRTIDIAIVSGNTSLMTSATYLQMMNGANYFAIGQPGRWEVCQVMTITNNGDNTFTFEGLRRGKGTSEEFTALHEAGDFVVWLSQENVQHLDYSIASLDEAFDFKPVGLGGTVETTASVNRTVTGEAEKIPKPCHLDASIDSPSDVRLSWVRRTRIGAYWSDNGDYTVPLGEALEQFMVRIKSGPGGTVLRTITVNNATFYDYSSAMQTTDFGSPLTSGNQLTYDIRQVSGTGVICPTREATIDL